MNWSKTLVAGAAAGITMMIANFVMHGLIMGPTYVRYPEVFSQDESGGNIVWFLVVTLLVALGLAVLFAWTRSAWSAGIAGGATFGAVASIAPFFRNFYDTMVFEGFPYYLAWCHGGMDVIAYVLGGAVLGLMLKQP